MDVYSLALSMIICSDKRINNSNNNDIMPEGFFKSKYKKNKKEVSEDRLVKIGVVTGYIFQSGALVFGLSSVHLPCLKQERPLRAEYFM